MKNRKTVIKADKPKLHIGLASTHTHHQHDEKDSCCGDCKGKDSCTNTKVLMNNVNADQNQAVFID